MFVNILKFRIFVWGIVYDLLPILHLIGGPLVGRSIILIGSVAFICYAMVTLVFQKMCTRSTKELSSSFGWPTKIHSNSYSFNLGSFAKSSISIAPLYLKGSSDSTVFLCVGTIEPKKDI